MLENLKELVIGREVKGFKIVEFGSVNPGMPTVPTLMVHIEHPEEGKFMINVPVTMEQIQSTSLIDLAVIVTDSVESFVTAMNR